MLKYMYMDYTTNALVCVHDTKVERILKTSANQFLDTLCRNRGSSLSVRKQYYKQKMNIHKFIPVVISKNEIFFPISNVRKHDCIWVNYQAIQEITYIKKECTIYFLDHTFLTSSNSGRIKHTTLNIRRFLHSYALIDIL